MSELLAVGVSHNTAPVEVRERLALPDARAAEFMHDLRSAADIAEAVAISTCNRTELYLVVDDPVEAESTVLAMMARKAGIRPTGLPVYSLRNCDAARHLYRVTSGLDSMVIGEAEIQGQVKRSYETALERETAGPLTRHLFQAALQTGKRVRSQTAISERAMSLPAVGVVLARELLGDLKGRTVVIVGTGETSELAARALASSGCHTVFVAARRRDRAVSLASAFNGDSVSFDELPEVLCEADIVVSATSSPHVLIEGEELTEVMQGRIGTPLLMIDLAVPRDIDPDCAGIPGVSLYDIDDLQSVIKRNRRVRQTEAQRAEGIIEEEIQHFARWLGSLEVLPTIKALRTRANEIASSVIDDNAGKWESASEKDLERIEAMARALVNRMLEEPTVKMRELRDDRVHARMALVRELFGLNADEQAYDESARPAAAAGPDPPPLTNVRVFPPRA